MASSVDERVVAMQFDNAKFEAGIVQTLASLAKLDEALKKVGAVNGLRDIEAAANKVTLQGPASAIDRLKSKLSFGREANQAFSEVETSSQKVKLDGATKATDTFRSKLSFHREADQAFTGAEASSRKFTLRGAIDAVSRFVSALGSIATTAGRVFGTVGQLAAKTAFAPAIKPFTDIMNAFTGVSKKSSDTMAGVESDASKVKLNGLQQAIQVSMKSFSVLEGAAAVALGNIASKMTMLGTAKAKEFGFGPIMAGLEEYQTNLKSIQTIQANTDRPLTEINASLEELNRYSDQTIYNFSEMAKNIGTFTAAGVDLQTATSSIKGIANMAALSGSSSQQAATAMYQLSQAISSGRVSLMDWNSVVNAGMGGKKLQTALATTAIAMGDIGEQSLKLEGPMKKLTINGQSFRESIMAQPGQESWLSSEILVNTLATLDGRFSKAALSAELTKNGLKKYTAAQVEASIADSRAALEKKNGVKYTDEQFEALMKLSDSAFKSATEVKTLGQVFDVAKETIGSGWAASFQNIFGNLTEAKETFTGLSNAINGFINASSLARNTMLSDWKELGGRTALIDGLKAAFAALAAILKPIGQAFRDVFPRQTGKSLYEMTVRFREFMESLKIGPETAENLRRTFRGFFAVLNIGKTIVGEIIGVIADLLGVAGDSAGGFLNFTGNIGDWLVQVDKAVSEGKALAGIFDGLSAVLQSPLAILKAIAQLIGGLFSGESGGGGGDPVAQGEAFNDRIVALQEKLGPLGDALGWVVERFQDLARGLQKVAEFFQPVIEKVGQVAGAITDGLRQAFENFDVDKAMNVLQTGILAGVALMIKKMISGGLGNALSGGVLDNLNGVLNELGGTLGAIQKNLNAKTLLTIATAVALLAASATLMATVDAEDLAKGMTAIAVGIGQMIAAVALLSKVGGLAAGSAVLPLIAAGMIGMASATVILAGAVNLFARLSWEDLAKGLLGVAGALTAVGLATQTMGPKLILIGPALIPVAIALNMIAVAMQLMGTLSWEEIVKGLIAMNTVLVSMAKTLPVMGAQMRVIGPGLLAVSASMILFSAAIRSFGSMDIASLAKGMAAFAGTLVILGKAFVLFPAKGMFVQAAALVVLSVALNGIAIALRIMGGLSLGGLIKSMIALGGSLAILAVGLYAMTGAGAGALALMGAAAALAVLAPTLALLGNLSIWTIIKGLATMAAVITVLAVAGGAAAPALYLLGLALSQLGIGMLLISGSIFILAAGISLLAKEGQAGIAALLVAITGFVALLPKIAVDFVKGLVEIIKQIGIMAPDIVASLVKILHSLVDAIIEIVPKLGEAIGTILGQMLVIIEQHAGPIFQAGLRLILEFLRGIANNIDQIALQASLIIQRFLDRMTLEAPKIIASGAKLLVAWLKGFEQHIGKVATAAFAVANKFLTTIANNLPKFILSGGSIIVKFLQGLAQQLPRTMRAGTDVIVAFVRGLGQNVRRVVKAAHQTIRDFLGAIGDEKQVKKTVAAGFDAAIDFINGITAGIRDDKKIQKLMDAAFDLGKEIAKQVVKGLGDVADEIAKKINPFDKRDDIEAADEAIVKDLERIARESEARARKSRTAEASANRKGMTEVGRAGGEGFIKGVTEKSPEVERATRSVVRRGIRGAKDEAKIKSPSQVFMEIGRFMVEGMSIGLQGLPGELDSRVRNPIRALLDITKDAKKLGRFLGSEFATGLAGSKDDIQAAFDGLKGQLKASQDELRASIKEDQGKLKDLLKTGQDSDKAIEQQTKELAKRRRDLAGATTREDYDQIYAEVQDAQTELNNLIAENQKADLKIKKVFRAISTQKDILEAAKSANAALFESLKDEKAALLSLADSYDGVLAKLEQVQEFINSTRDKFDQLPDVDALVSDAMADAELDWEQRIEKMEERRKEAERRRRIDQVELYKNALAEQIRATIKYNETLEKLRALGLDDRTYQQLLDKGTAGQEFADQLLRGGEKSIQELNELNAKLTEAADKMAKNAADQLYNAGVHTAEGLVAGLQAQAENIKAIMNAIAQDMVDTIKKKLKIKSPSQVFAQLGGQTGEGFAVGLRGSTATVVDAAGAVGDEATSAMTKSLSKVSDTLNSEIDPNLVITPVLDLSNVERDAKKMGGILNNVTPITAAASYKQATSISEEREASQTDPSEGPFTAAPSLVFEQNNYSPESLSEIEIYRQTNNQLAQAKAALGIFRGGLLQQMGR